MARIKKYWKGIEELRETPEFEQKKHDEFPESLPEDLFSEETVKLSSSRRDFLKYLGFGVTAASLASCEAPVQKAIPYLIKPEEVTPGVANWYATNYFDGYDYCDVLVKTREGRPIKIEGNKLSPITKGGVNARVHASVLSLYDSARLKGPVANKQSYSWESVDNAITKKLNEINGKGGNIRILSSTIISPSTKKVIEAFTAKYPTTKHITYDTVSYYAIAKAHESSFGKAVIPTFSLNKADIIVSFGADFLANWLSPVEYATQYAERRKLKDEDMSRHIQFETTMSLTGSNADKRYAIKPSQEGKLLLSLYNKLAGKAGQTGFTTESTEHEEAIKKVAGQLWNARGRAVVVCGSNDYEAQLLVNEINRALGAYDNIIDIKTPTYTRKGNDADVVSLVEEMKSGAVDALLVYNCNPVYSLPPSLGFEQGVTKVGMSISFSDREDETASKTDFICPDNHYFESWNDAHPRKGVYALTQPVIKSLFNTRQFQESLLKWAGQDISYYDFIKQNWEKELFSKQNEFGLFSAFWNNSVHDGVTTLAGSNEAGEAIASENTANVNPAEALNKAAENINSRKPQEGFELVLYEKGGIGIGNQANNPWLHELPDPISKVTWDNYITMSPKQMKEFGFNTLNGQEQKADIVKLSLNGSSVDVPVLAQPGQTYGTIGLALGYGRTEAGKAADNVGVNAYVFSKAENDYLQYKTGGANIGGSIGKYHLAATQTHHTMMGRDIVKETTLTKYHKDPASGNAIPLISIKEDHEHVKKPAEELSLWKKHEEVGPMWNLSIDLNACIGCSACLISCQAENNVPVVGKDEVRRAREMHWIRIDRYYTSDADEHDLSGMENPSENPEVVYQPVMCQHCNNASCETVCPVIATSHSVDGLNQMTYNRCVGTRYCANNCPYKVRRFNWFNYYRDEKFEDVNPAMDDLTRMVLNPDVVVRSRGVMEKCSMCIQRIQEGKLKAKTENRALKDGDIQTACSQSCPTNAIVFGNVNDEKSEVAQLRKNERSYRLLEEIGVRPNVFYMTKVRNKDIT